MRNWSIRVFFGQTTTLERLNALTDGVYAIVITLLILDLQMPESGGLTEGQLLSDLLQQIPNFVAYVLSFIWWRFFG